MWSLLCDLRHIKPLWASASCGSVVVGAQFLRSPVAWLWEEGSLVPAPYCAPGPPALGHGAHVLGGQSGGLGSGSASLGLSFLPVK